MAGYPVGFEFIIGPRTSGKDRIADRLDLLDERSHRLPMGPARDGSYRRGARRQNKKLKLFFYSTRTCSSRARVMTRVEEG